MSNMLKFLRLTDSLRKFSLFELSSLFQLNARTTTVLSSKAAIAAAAAATTVTAKQPIVAAARPSPLASLAKTESSQTVNIDEKNTMDTTKSVDHIENIDGVVKFLELVGNLKHIKRTGWLLRNVNDCETVAGHMYRMSIMTFLLDGKNGLDRTKCMELALVHDLAESIVGDITPYCGVSKEDKKLREMNAMRDIAKLIEPRGDHLMELFEEYEENQTPESKFVKDLDRLDMVLQAYEYEKRDNCIKTHQEFFDSTDGKFNHPLVVNLVNEIKAQREATAAAATSTAAENQQTNSDDTNNAKQATSSSS